MMVPNRPRTASQGLLGMAILSLIAQRPSLVNNRPSHHVTLKSTHEHVRQVYTADNGRTVDDAISQVGKDHLIYVPRESKGPAPQPHASRVEHPLVLRTCRR
jgi:hypothetical protein